MVAVMASSLDHIEQTLADAYRREVEQEENIWRSLPFFAAALALELGAIYQIAGHLPPASTAAWRVSVGFIIVAGVSTLTALGFLAASIFPAKLNYLPPEPDLLDYAERLDEYQRHHAAHGDASVDALALLKKALAHELAVAIYHNHAINERRTSSRSVAGLAIVAGVWSIIGLVGTATSYYVWSG